MCSVEACHVPGGQVAVRQAEASTSCEGGSPPEVQCSHRVLSVIPLARVSSCAIVRIESTDGDIQNIAIPLLCGD
jgi:hypothetical protein